MKTVKLRRVGNSFVFTVPKELINIHHSNHPLPFWEWGGNHTLLFRLPYFLFYHIFDKNADLLLYFFATSILSVNSFIASIPSFVTDDTRK